MFPELLAKSVRLSESQIAALSAHYDLLCRWNKTLNLTRIEKVAEVVELHYCESLFLAERLEAGRVIDVGSGAGFPGFVVAIARPDCHVTLIESHQRKAVFLREVSRSYPNVRVLARRAEDISESFETLISRAVSYSDLGNCLHLAPRMALLTGAEEPPGSWQMEWNAIPLPAGKSRFLRLGKKCFT